MKGGLLLTTLPDDGQSGRILLLLHLQKVLPSSLPLNGLPLSPTELTGGPRATGGRAWRLFGADRGPFSISQ